MVSSSCKLLTGTTVAQGKATSPGSGLEQFGLVGIQLQFIGRRSFSSLPLILFSLHTRKF